MKKFVMVTLLAMAGIMAIGITAVAVLMIPDVHYTDEGLEWRARYAD